MIVACALTAVALLVGPDPSDCREVTEAQKVTLAATCEASDLCSAQLKVIEGRTFLLLILDDRPHTLIHHAKVQS